MSRQWQIALSASVVGALCFVLSGCAEKQGQMNMADMKPPPRPAELDKLEQMIGTWDETMEIHMAGSDQVMKGKGTSTVGWEADKWVMLERGEFSMADTGEKEYGLGIWRFDTKSKEFHTFWTMSGGEMMHGEATFDDATKTWKMESSGTNQMFGKIRSEGTAKLVDKNTMEWKMTMWNAWKTKKLMEMTGTGKRR